MIGILHHPHKPESLELAQEIDQFLRQRNYTDIWHESAWDADSNSKELRSVDFLITLGGDGTLLRAARMGAAHGVPMLGVKMGRLGFVAEVMPDDWQDSLEAVLNDNYWIEERLMVRARVERPIEKLDEKLDKKLLATPSVKNDTDRAVICEYDALNDIVLSRGDLARVVRIAVQLDGSDLTRYTCDGLIVSTATGSTGYALAVRGPILPPELRNILVIPIAPHLSMDRAVVLSEGAEVRMQVTSDYGAMLTVDGQVMVEVENDDDVVVVGSPHLARFIRLRDRGYFYKALMEKLSWSG